MHLLRAASARTRAALRGQQEEEDGELEEGEEGQGGEGQGEEKEKGGGGERGSKHPRALARRGPS